MNLTYDSTRGNAEWKYNVGKVQVDKVFKDYVHIEMGYQVSHLNQKKLVGNFFKSPPSGNDWPKWLDSMNLNCK